MSNSSMVIETVFTEGVAAQLYQSLYKFYLKLTDDVLVYAAHGSGSPCGANISDRLVSTIGYERRNNEALHFNDKAKFVEFVLHTAPPEPVYYSRMKKLNAEGPEVLGRLPSCTTLPPLKFELALENGNVQLLDNRQMRGFGGVLQQWLSRKPGGQHSSTRWILGCSQCPRKLEGLAGCRLRSRDAARKEEIIGY